MNPHTTSVGLDVLVTGKLPTPHAYVFRAEGAGRLGQLLAVLRSKGGTIDCPCLAFVVRHPSAGEILIDTGFHRDASENLRRDFGVRMAWLFRTLRPADLSYDEQLRAVGIEPGLVERVLMTHLHVDHTSGIRLLPAATFVCARDEWRAATRRGAAGKGFVAHHLPAESRMELLDFRARGEPYGPFSSTVDFLGDGSIRLISTPGHTPGHMSVLLRVGEGRQVLVVGDAVYTLRSLREELLPFLTIDDAVYLRTLRELKAFSEQEPGALLVPSHDPPAWHQLREVTGSAERELAGPA